MFKCMLSSPRMQPLPPSICSVRAHYRSLFETAWIACKLCPQERLIKSSCSHYSFHNLRNARLVWIWLWRGAMFCYSKHLLSTSSSSEAEMGMKRSRWKSPCSGRTSQGRRGKAFILNKLTIASKTSINFLLVGPGTDSSFCDDGWWSFWRTTHESCGAACNSVGLSICSYTAGRKGKHLLCGTCVILDLLWSDFIAAGTLDQLLSVCSIIHLIWWWISLLRFGNYPDWSRGRRSITHTFLHTSHVISQTLLIGLWLRGHDDLRVMRLSKLAS